MKQATHRNAIRIQKIIGANFRVLEFELPTRTVAEAAAAINCKEAQIAKSLVFRSKTDRPVLVVASGVNRVDVKKVAAVVGENIARADPTFVRAHSGHAIGGIPPVGHQSTMTIVLDRDLLVFHEIWAAAGTPNAVFCLTPDDLQTLTGAEFHDVGLL